MTNREKLIDLLTERDGQINVYGLGRFLSESPLIENCRGLVGCNNYHSCRECVTQWLNEESEEK